MGRPGAGSWPFLHATVSSSFRILSRQQYFPLLTRSQLQVGSAFLLSGIMMRSILEPLVTHLLQHLIHWLGELWGREAQERAGREMEAEALCRDCRATVLGLARQSNRMYWILLCVWAMDRVLILGGPWKQVVSWPLAGWGKRSNNAPSCLGLQGKPSRLLLCNFHGSHP